MSNSTRQHCPHKGARAPAGMHLEEMFLHGNEYASSPYWATKLAQYSLLYLAETWFSLVKFVKIQGQIHKAPVKYKCINHIRFEE